MSDNSAINRPWTVLPIISALIIALLVFYKGSWWLWFALASWVVLTLVAILALSDDKSREFQSATLKHSNYTQIYKVLVGRSHDRLWAAYCDPVDRGAGLWAMFRAALTWRLYDRAMLLAVIYPILLPVLWWLVTGQAAQLGPVVFLEATGFRDVWPERVAILVTLSMLILSKAADTNAKTNPQYYRRILLRLAIPLALTLSLCIVVLSGFSIVLFLAAFTASFMAFFAPVRGAGVLGLGFASALSAMWSLATVGAGAIAVSYTIHIFDDHGHRRLVRLLITTWVVVVGTTVALFADWGIIQLRPRTVFLFLGVLPLINALFDVISYAVTMSFIRRGRVSRVPWLYGLADLGVALVLFLALGVTMVAVIAGLNGLAGTDILDLGALLRDVRDQPGSYWWLYGIAFSTILPTALHAALALLGVQGLWPKPLRRVVAGWIGNASASQIDATRGAFALGLLWAVPVWVIVVAGWAAWHCGGTLATSFASQYLTVLERVAATLGAW